MSQSVPPPGNPFSEGAAPQTGNPFADGAVPSGPPAPVRANIAGGVVAAVIAALVSAALYGWIIGLSDHEIGYAAVGVGLLVGFAAGKVGGSHVVLPVLSAVLSLGAVYLGQIFGLAMLIGKQAKISSTDIIVNHFSELTSAWNDEVDAMSFLFLAIGAYAAFTTARKA
jgi:hypothetical protein